MSRGVASVLEALACDDCLVVLPRGAAMSVVDDDAKVLVALLAAYGPVECERLSRRATRWRLGALPTSGEGHERLRELCEQHEAWLAELAQLEVDGFDPAVCWDEMSERHAELIKLTGAGDLDRFSLMLQQLNPQIDVDPKPRG